MIIFIFFLFLSGKSFTLKDCIEIAEKNNEELLFAKTELDLAKEKYREALSMRYPQLLFDAYYAKHKLIFPSILSFPYGGFLLPQDRDISYGAKITFSQLLYSGGRVKLIKTQAELYYKERKAYYLKKLNELYFDVKKIFYRSVYHKKRIELLKEIYEEKKDDYILLEIEDAEADYKNSIAELKRVMGVEFSEDINVEGELVERTERIDKEKIIAKAFEYRPDLKGYTEWEKLSELSARLVYLERRPNLKIFSTFDYLADPYSREERWKKNWEVAVVLSFPLFDGFAGWSRWRQKKLILKQSRIKKAALENDLRFEIEKTINEYERNVNKIEFLKKREKKDELKFLELLYENNILWEKLIYLTGEETLNK